jgi:hypothetical protein
MKRDSRSFERNGAVSNKTPHRTDLENGEGKCSRAEPPSVYCSVRLTPVMVRHWGERGARIRHFSPVVPRLRSPSAGLGRFGSQLRTVREGRTVRTYPRVMGFPHRFPAVSKYGVRIATPTLTCSGNRARVQRHRRRSATTSQRAWCSRSREPNSLDRVRR